MPAKIEKRKEKEKQKRYLRERGRVAKWTAIDNVKVLDIIREKLENQQNYSRL